MGSIVSLVELVKLKLSSPWKQGGDVYHSMTLFGVGGVAFLTLPFTNPRRELRLSVIVSSQGQNTQGILQLVRHVVSFESLSKLDYFRLQKPSRAASMPG